MALGIGVGTTSVATLGLPRATRAELRDYVATVRALLAGDAVPATSGPMRLAYARSGSVPPVLIGAASPRMLRLAGEIADGVIVTSIGRAGTTLEAMLAHVREGRAAAGRLDAPFLTCLGVAVAVDADRGEALAAVRPHVAASALVHNRWPLSAAAQAAAAHVREVYTTAEHMSPSDKFADIIPDDVVQEYALAGTPDDCVAQTRSLFAAGIDEITIRPFALAGGTRAATTDAFAAAVFPAFVAR
jgi:5,10-methylenetetrahydromethanopterin reductase